MAEVPTLSSGRIFQQEYMLAADPGSTLFYAQVHPGDYPGDRKIMDDLQARGGSLSELVSGKWLDLVRERTAAGVNIERLLVMRARGEPGYDRKRLDTLRRIFEPIREAGESLRLTTFARQAGRLASAQANPDLVRRYRRGAKSGSPKSSFWAVIGPDQLTLQTAWIMDYSGQRFTGGPLYTESFPQGVSRYISFWRRVFTSQTESRPLFHW